jgi:acyl-CoA synthetase (NDP forming)/GNAT superfamily N-acetyltransferase
MTPGTDPATPGEPYPRHWEADALASDGGVLHIRPIRPDDADQILGLHSRMSERTRYLRYFGSYPRIPPRDLERFTVVDHRARVALVAEVNEQLIAVARYEKLPAEEAAKLGGGAVAEVAFVVEDAHQGRGVGSVLLEHLAAAARERGIDRFQAYVLAENPRMVRVFLDAGYQVERTYESGLVHLTFDIAPTAESVAVTYAREQRAEARSIKRLLTPRSVAVIGASADPHKVGHVVFRNLLAFSPNGPVYPINPETAHVSGVRAYASVLDVPDDIDLAVVAVPARAVPAVVAECAAKNVHGLVVLSAGFADLDEDGARAQRELVASARQHGMRVVGPNCLGVLNTDPDVRLNATLAPLTNPQRGRVGFFSQSGALGIAILAEAERRGLGLTTFVSAGNRADVSGNDLLQFWEEDEATEVVLLYLESFGNPRKFARLARRVARTKPVVAVRSGRHSAGLPELPDYAAPVPEERVPELFARHGVIQVDTVAELFDVAQLLAYQPLPAGPRVAIIGNSTALGTLAADACRRQGLRPDRPLDIGAAGSAADFAAALDTVLGDPDVGALVVVFVPPLASSGAEVAQVLADRTAAWERPVVSTFLATDGLPAQLRRIGPDGGAARGSVPSYPSPERAVRALAHAARHADWRREPPGSVPTLRDLDPAAARAAIGRTDTGRDLTDPELAAVLHAYGIHYVHAAPRDPAGTACVVGVVDDPSFGALVWFGLAGIATELLGDRAYAAVPLTTEQASALVRAPRAAPLLAGADQRALRDLVLRVARLADDLPQVLALELNPVYAAERGLAVAGARIRVGPPTARTPVGPRRLREATDATPPDRP